MPLDVESMATEVVLLMKTALTPVLERLAVTEARLTDLQQQMHNLAALPKAVSDDEIDEEKLEAMFSVVQRKAIEAGLYEAAA